MSGGWCSSTLSPFPSPSSHRPSYTGPRRQICSHPLPIRRETKPRTMYIHSATDAKATRNRLRYLQTFDRIPTHLNTKGKSYRPPAGTGSNKVLKLDAYPSLSYHPIDSKKGTSLPPRVGGCENSALPLVRGGLDCDSRIIPLPSTPSESKGYLHGVPSYIPGLSVDACPLRSPLQATLPCGRSRDQPSHRCRYAETCCTMQTLWVPTERTYFQGCEKFSPAPPAHLQCRLSQPCPYCHLLFVRASAVIPA